MKRILYITPLLLLVSPLAYGQKIKTIHVETWENNAWKNGHFQNFSYDENGFWVKNVFQQWNDQSDTWYNFSQLNITNNNEGLIENTVNQQWNEQDDNWKNGSKTEYTYTNSKKYQTELNYNWEEGEWLLSSKYTYEYDDNDLNTQKTLQFIANNEWVNISKNQYFSTQNGLVDYYLVYNWNDQTNEWELKSRISYSYNNDGNQTIHLHENWENNQWQPTTKFSTSYDENGNESSLLGQFWDIQSNSWKNSYQNHIVNYPNGYKHTSTFEYWNSENDVWVTSSRATYTYLDEQNNDNDNNNDNNPATFTLELSSEQEVDLTGAGEYEIGATVEISAPSLDGYTFAGWSGSDEDIALLEDASLFVTSFTMPARDVSFLATYQLNQDVQKYSVSLQSAQNVTLSGAGEYNAGDQVNISTQQLTGYTFVGWTGTGDDMALLSDAKSLEASFTMPSRNVNYTAEYVSDDESKYTLTLSSALEVNLVGGGEYIAGTTVEMTAEVPQGYTFAGWEGSSDDIALISNAESAQATIKMPSRNVELIAKYSQVGSEAKFTVSLGTNQAVMLSGMGEYKAGDGVAISAPAMNGFAFEQWSGAAEDVALLSDALASQTSFVMPNRNVTLTAEYKPVVTGIEEHNIQNLSISPNPCENYVQINLTKRLATKVSIHNQQGAFLKQYVFDVMRPTIDIRDLPAGIYFVKIQHAKGKTTHRLVKK